MPNFQFVRLNYFGRSFCTGYLIYRERTELLCKGWCTKYVIIAEMIQWLYVQTPMACSTHWVGHEVAYLYIRDRKRTSEVRCAFKGFLDTKTVLTFDPERNLQLTTKFKKLNTVLIFWFISTSYQYSIDRICCKKINVHNVKKISDYILLLTTTKNFVFICFFFVQSHLLSN